MRFLSMKKLKKSSGQNLIEYCMVLILIMTGIILMGPYVVQSWNAHLKGWEDSIIDSFEDPLDQAKSVNIDFPECSCEWKAPCATPPCCGFEGCSTGQSAEVWTCNITHCEFPKIRCTPDSVNCKPTYECQGVELDSEQSFKQQLCAGSDEDLTEDVYYSYVTDCAYQGDKKCEVQCLNHFVPKDSLKDFDTLIDQCGCPESEDYTAVYEDATKEFLERCGCPTGYVLWDDEMKNPFAGDCGCPPGYKEE